MSKNKMINLNQDQVAILRNILTTCLDLYEFTTSGKIVAAQIIKKLDGRSQNQEEKKK